MALVSLLFEDKAILHHQHQFIEAIISCFRLFYRQTDDRLLPRHRHEFGFHRRELNGKLHRLLLLTLPYTYILVAPFIDRQFNDGDDDVAKLTAELFNGEWSRHALVALK